jgi:hypothetical protein
MCVCIYERDRETESREQREDEQMSR